MSNPTIPDAITGTDQKPGAHIPVEGAHEEKLTDAEKKKFERNVHRLRALEGSWLKQTQIVCQIRDERLYREQYPTFQKFCLAELEMTDANLNRRIQCAEIAVRLTTIVANPKESHIRPLLSLKDHHEQQAQCFHQAVNTARKRSRPLRATDVAAAVKAILGSKEATGTGVGNEGLSGNPKADIITRISRAFMDGLENYSAEQFQDFESRIIAMKKEWMDGMAEAATAAPEGGDQ